MNAGSVGSKAIRERYFVTVKATAPAGRFDERPSRTSRAGIQQPPVIGLPVTVDPDRLSTEFARACEDAGLDPRAWVVWIVDALRPPGTTPVAYLQPAGDVRPDTVLVFRAVGAERVDPYRLTAHRLAIWRVLPGMPDAALGPMLRHELEHARRWERSGTAFYEADERLRASVGRSGYAQLPTEREANAAAAAYAQRTLSAPQLESGLG